MSTATFIQQLYSRFLGRDADSAGVEYWQQQLEGSAVNAAQATLDFINSVEFSGTVAPIARLYYATLDRIPDADGLLYWVNQYQNGSSLDDICSGFMTSTEFQNNYGDLSDDNAFLEQLYQNVLNRGADSDGLSYWLGLMGQGMSRSEVVDGFANSAEFTQAKGADIEILLIYHGILGTQPTQAQIDAALAEDNPLALITELYNSESYTGTSVPGLTSKGVVVDGYVSGATVFIDSNGDGILSPGEVSTTTDALGNFDFGENGGYGNIVMYGGTDISTGQPFEGSMTAPGGSTVVNPLTTLVNAISQSENITVEQASSLLLSNFGLDSNIDLTSYDPIAEAGQSNASQSEIDTALTIHSLAVQINNLVSQSAALLNGVGIIEDEAGGINSVYAALGSALASGTNDNLSDSNFIQQVIENAAQQSGANSGQISNVQNLGPDASQTISNLNQAIQNAVDNNSDSLGALSEMAAIQIVSEAIENQMQSGAQNGDVGGTTTSTQGSNLTDSVNNAGSNVGDVNGDGEGDPNSGSTTPTASGGSTSSGGGGGSAPPPGPTFTVTHDTNANTVTFGGTVTGDITITWNSDLATFSRGGITASTTVDFDPSPKPTLIIASGQTLSTTVAEISAISNMVISGDGNLTLTGTSTIAQLNSFDYSGVNGTTSYSVSDTAVNLLANGTTEPLTSATAVSVQGGDAGALTIQEYDQLLLTTSDDSWIYAISDAATNLLSNGSGEPLPNATAVSVSGGAAGALSMSNYYSLLTLTTDDTWSYNLSDALLYVVDADASVLNGATDITVSSYGNIQQISTVVNATNSGTTSFVNANPLRDIAANYFEDENGTFKAGVEALLNSGYSLKPNITDTANYAQMSAIYNITGYIYASGITDTAANLANNTPDFLNGLMNAVFTDAATVSQVETVMTHTSGTLTYALSDTAANLLDSNHSSIISGATAVSVSGGDAGNLTMAEYSQLLATTTDDSWSYDLSDLAFRLGDADSTVLDGATNITSNGTGNIAQISAIVNANNSGTTSFLNSYPLLDIAANYGSTDGVLAAGVEALLTSGYTLNPTISDAATIAQLSAIEAVIGSQDLSYSDIIDTSVVLAANADSFLNGQINVTFTDAATIAQVTTVDGNAAGTLTYAISDTATNILNASSGIISAATAVSVQGGDASLISVADYAQLLTLTSDDSWSYTLVDTFTNIVSLDSTVLANATAVHPSGDATLTDAQHDALPTTTDAAGVNNTLTLSDAASITALETVESYVLGNFSNSIILSDSGNSVTGGTNTDIMTNGLGVDTMNGGAGDDQFIYWAEDDLFIANTLVDTLDGGADTDALVISGSGTNFTINAADSFGTKISNIEKIITKDYNSSVNLVLNDNAYEAGITTIDLSLTTANYSANTIDVSNESNTANGWTIIGSVGNDAITGGAGPDTITGGANGDNIYLIADDNIRDTVIYTETTDGSSAGSIHSADYIYYPDLNGNDATDDLIAIDGNLETLLDDNSDGILQTTATDGSYGGNQALGLASGDEITVLLSADVDLIVSDFVTGGWADVLTNLDDNIDFSAFNNGDTHLFLVNTSGISSDNDAGLFLYTDNGGDDTIEAADLQLLGIIIDHNDGTDVVAGDIAII